MSEEQQAGSAMQVDYQMYADVEALLGWLNCTVQLTTKKKLDSDKFLNRLAHEVQERLQA